MGYRRALLLLAIVVCAVAAVPAVGAAQTYGGGTWQRRAYDTGYRDGVAGGERDARARRAWSYQDDRSFRSADEGHRGLRIDRESYRRVYRSGYADGYAAGYRRFGGYVPNSGRGRGPSQVYRSPGGQNRDPYWNRAPGYGYGASSGYNNGVADGYEKGLEDVRKNRSFDVLRHKWYRSGDRHYERRYGSKDAYRAAYQQGFRRGYEDGFRAGVYRY